MPFEGLIFISLYNEYIKYISDIKNYKTYEQYDFTESCKTDINVLLLNIKNILKN